MPLLMLILKDCSKKSTAGASGFVVTLMGNLPRIFSTNRNNRKFYFEFRSNLNFESRRNIGEMAECDGESTSFR